MHNARDESQLLRKSDRDKSPSIKKKNAKERMQQKENAKI